MVPKISVIIPVYNSEDFLQQCLDSVTKQTIKEIEIICIDDGSEDKSLNILENNKKKDRRIIIINQAHCNAGVARNRGLEIAKGEYLYFLDSDDYIENYALEKAYTKAKENNADITIFSAYTFFNTTNKPKLLENSLEIKNCPKKNPFNPMEMNQYLFNSFQNWPWNKLYESNFIKNNKIMFQDVDRTNDMLFTCKSLMLSNRIFILNEPLVYHRVGRRNSMQATNYLEPDAFMTAYTETMKALKKIANNQYDMIEQSFINWVLKGLRHNYKSIQADKNIEKYIKELILYKGNNVFNILEHQNDYYYDKDDLAWYKSLSGKKRIKSVITSVSKCLKENGIIYTVKRILFHLHIIKDNDPYGYGKGGN